MTLNRWIMAAAGIAFVLPAYAGQKENPAPRAPAAVGGPETVIYRVSGVRDNGDPDGTGVATSFHCTNLSTVDETLRIVVRDDDSTIVANDAFTLTPFRTWTASTHFTNVYAEDASLATGNVNQGMGSIAATTLNMVCSVVTVNAASANISGVSLHLVRLSPIPGSQE